MSSDEPSDFSQQNRNSSPVRPVYSVVVPENVIPAEPNTSSGELAGAFVTGDGERWWKVVRLGVAERRI